MFRGTLFSLMTVTLLCSVLPAQGQDALPEGNGKNIVQSACAECHSLDLITRGGHDRDEWQVVLDQMMADGAKVTKAQAQGDAIIELAKRIQRTNDPWEAEALSKQMLQLAKEDVARCRVRRRERNGAAT